MIYFIAAGKGSRMESEIPKALHDINGEPNLLRNVKGLKYDYKIVIDKSQSKFFNKYFNSEDIITINSGFGSGHAIMQIDLKSDDIIIWGDAVIHDYRIIEELLNRDGFSIPLKKVSNPYVNFLCDEHMKIKNVLFSKYGDNSLSGLQDCCIFKVDDRALDDIKSFHNATWKGGYITESKEFEFLYLIYYRVNSDDPINGYITDFPGAVSSYNTNEELKNINERI